MATVKVTVTREDYIEAECHSIGNCVLARAIQRATRNKGWLVDGDAVRHEKKDIYAVAPAWFDEVASFADNMLVPDNGGISSLPCFLFSFPLDTVTGAIGDRTIIERVDLQEIWEERIRRGIDKEPRGFKWLADTDEVTARV